MENGMINDMCNTIGRRIPLESIPNARDLGGYKTLDGRCLKYKKLIRSGTLGALTQNDRKILLNEYDLKVIIDLRTDRERKENPDPIIEGVTSYHNPILKDETFGVTREGETNLKQKDSFDYAEMLMNHIKKMEENGHNLGNLYAEFVESEYSLSQYRKFFEFVIHHKEGALLWHCTAGKDRVGTTTAILLRILGVDMETIMEDFLLTNEFLKEQTRSIVNQVSRKTSDERIIHLVAKLNSVEECYLVDFFNTIDRDYGSFDDFVSSKLGMTQEDIDVLKEKYLAE